MSKTNEDPAKVANGEAGKSEGDGLPNVSPDVIEQEHGDEFDDIVPTRGYQMTPMVGLGGSAGSIQAMKDFFRSMPADSGMIFVVILHLSPEHESALPEVLAHDTEMKVFTATNGMKVETNCVYVIPPGKHLVTVNGHLRLDDLDHARGKRVAVDLFFRSLADTHGPHGAAIVFSGADSDGAVGIKRIKERGGLTVVQDPDEAESSGMPRAAIDTGMVDWVLRAEEMPGRLKKYFEHERRVRMPSEDGPQPAQVARLKTDDENEAALREILSFLRTRTGRDFSYYKRATIVRRISRRLQINGVDDLPAYLAFLRTHQGEAGALLQDLLISVTNFFRDRDAFAALEPYIPRLFENKTAEDTVRVWSPACATGEEAYSLAMLLLEHARTLEAPPLLQVFGCDLDDAAIQIARAGAYPDTIAADVSEDRLRRYFTKEHRGYRVRREVREIVLFAQHDLLKDAPFSRLDLISCRNLLIYLNRDAQQRAMDIFHFACHPHATLFLGSSESVEDGSPLFDVVDKKHRIYRQRPAPRGGTPVPVGPGTLARALEAQERARVGPVLPGRALANGMGAPFAPSRSRNDEAFSSAELHFRLVERLAPPSIVVSGDHELVHVSENAGRFLQVTGGEPTRNLLRLVHPLLGPDLRSALFQAAEMDQTIEVPHIPFELGGEACTVTLRVSPAADLAPGYLLVVFEISEAKAGEEGLATAVERPKPQPIVRQLEREIETMRMRLRDNSEQYEASNEELKASNEELQAMNEELRSASEELETSREELQSINEELTTVNQELKTKVDELAHANSDLHNLMNATAIAIIFLDRQLRITRYTPTAVEIFNLIPTDVGRPLADLQRRIDYDELEDDAARVIEQLVPIEREVGDHGRWFLSRMLPYRTVDDRIAGVVATFVDVTARRDAERNLADDLQRSEQLLVVSEQIAPVDDMQALFDVILKAGIDLMKADAGTVRQCDPETQEVVLLATHGFPENLVTRFSQVNALSGKSLGERAFTERRRILMDFNGPPEEVDPESTDALSLAEGFFSAQATPLIARSGRPIGVLSTHWKKHHRPEERELRYLDLLARQAADAIEQKLGEHALRQQMDELSRFNSAAVGRELRMIELKKEINGLAERLGEGQRYPLDFEEKEREDSNKL
jgi:two-component system, chemotaxis family, CheB/CheR fusion protein